MTRRFARFQKFRFVEWRWKKSRITVKNQGFQAPKKCRFLSIDNWVPHMSCPFTGLKMFWAGSNFLCETKNSFTLQVSKCYEQVQIFCARQKIHLHIVAVKKKLCQTKRWFEYSFLCQHKSFWRGTTLYYLLREQDRLTISKFFTTLIFFFHVLNEFFAPLWSFFMY